jgi:hypothetical protein
MYKFFNVLIFVVFWKSRDPSRAIFRSKYIQCTAQVLHDFYILHKTQDKNIILGILKLLGIITKLP